MAQFRALLRGILPLLAFAGIAAYAPPAKAAMSFCNRTEYALDAALGFRNGTAWMSQGWWRIEPGACAKVMSGHLTERFYFYYATSLVRTAKDKPPFEWTGKYQFCTLDASFRIEGDGECESKGYRTRLFGEIDLGPTARDYTLDFKD